MGKFWAVFILYISIMTVLILTSCASITVFYDRNGKCIKIKDEFGFYRDCKNDDKMIRDRR